MVELQQDGYLSWESPGHVLDMSLDDPFVGHSISSCVTSVHSDLARYPVVTPQYLYFYIGNSTYKVDVHNQQNMRIAHIQVVLREAISTLQSAQQSSIFCNFLLM